MVTVETPSFPVQLIIRHSSSLSQVPRRAGLSPATRKSREAHVSGDCCWLVTARKKYLHFCSFCHLSYLAIMHSRCYNSADLHSNFPPHTLPRTLQQNNTECQNDGLHSGFQFLPGTLAILDNFSLAIQLTELLEPAILYFNCSLKVFGHPLLPLPV